MKWNWLRCQIKGKTIDILQQMYVEVVIEFKWKTLIKALAGELNYNNKENLIYL